MKFAALIMLALGAYMWGQTISSGQAKTEGPCSPAVSGNHNQVTITCKGISDKMSAQLVDLMNRIAKNQLDAEAVMDKLDGCLAGVKEVREEQQPWHLTDDEKTQLLTSLRLAPPYANPARISVNVIPTDRNASLFAMDLLVVLKEAKVADGSTGLNSDFTLRPDLVGVTLAVTHPDFPEAAFLLDAFSRAGIKVNVFIDKDKKTVHDDNTIEIAIGAKPSPAQ